MIGNFLPKCALMESARNSFAFFPEVVIEATHILQFLCGDLNQVGGTQTSGWFVFPPEWEAACGRWIVQTISFHSCHQQGGIRSDMEGGLARDGGIRPYLCLPDSQQVFFFFLIGLNLPAIEIRLQSSDHGYRGVTDKEIGWLAVQGVPMSAIAQRPNDDQSQGACTCATAPQDWSEGL